MGTSPLSSGHLSRMTLVSSVHLGIIESRLVTNVVPCLHPDPPPQNNVTLERGKCALLNVSATSVGEGNLLYK